MTARDEELLSAYLDGEVTADEQAHVERLLSTDAEYRQLHDELRALRTSLESLPRFEVGESLADRVLRRAEVEMLRGGSTSAAVIENPAASADATLVDTPPADAPHADTLARPAVERSKRVWIYPLLAVAAAVMIAIGSQLGRDADDVKLAGKDAAPPAGQAREAAGEEKAARLADGRVDHGRPRTTEKGDDSAKLSSRPDNSREDRPLPAAPRAIPPADEELSAARMARSTKDVPEAQAAEAAAGVAERLEVHNSLGDRELTTKGARSRAAAAADHDLLVVCAVTREALENGALEKLLTRHQIEVERDSDKSGVELYSAEVGQQTRKPAAQPRPKNGQSEQLDGWLVDADGEKIRSALAELKEQQTAFLAIDPQPLRRDDALDWSAKYRRGDVAPLAAIGRSTALAGRGVDPALKQPARGDAAPNVVRPKRPPLATSNPAVPAEASATQPEAAEALAQKAEPAARPPARARRVEIPLDRLEAIRRQTYARSSETTTATLGEGDTAPLQIKEDVKKSTAGAASSRVQDDRLRVLFVLKVVETPTAAAPEK